MKETSVIEHKQLLLINNDAHLNLLLQDYLEFRGYQVITAQNGWEALEVLEHDIPDMILCEVMMPKIDGYTLVNHVRKDIRTKLIPVLFLCTKGQSQDRIKGLSTGADVYMIKPFEPEELVAQVEASLNQCIRQRQHPLDESENMLTINVPFDVHLTQTEQKVLQFVARGLANRDIANELNLSSRTVEKHVSNMLSKIGIHNRTELARWAIENRWRNKEEREREVQ